MVKKIISGTMPMVVAAIASVSMMTSCDNNPDDANNITVNLSQAVVEYDDNGVWSEAMNENSVISAQGLIFSHAGMPQWNSWNGFVPSRSNDTRDYSSGNWLEHQYTCIKGGGLSGESTPYFVAYWNSSEDLSLAATTATPSCRITYATSEHEFIPVSAFVTNTTYAYYAMVNGTAYNRKFAKGDYLKLQAYGITKDGKVTGPAEVNLAYYLNDNDKPVSEWTYFNMESLGLVRTVFFRMESSDSGQWGMNTPAYFALDRMSIKLQ